MEWNWRAWGWRFRFIHTLKNKKKTEYYTAMLVYFSPKFYCKLNTIERCWSQTKRYTRAHCKYTIAGLCKNVPHGLNCVTTDNILNLLNIICLGVFGWRELEDLVKIYTSYRKVEVNEKFQKINSKAVGFNIPQLEQMMFFVSAMAISQIMSW